MSPVGEKQGIPLIGRAAVHGDRTAVVDDTGVYSYRALLESSARAASVLLAGAADLGEARVAFLAPPGFEYVAVQWGIWRAGGVAVPFAVSHPEAELEYTVDDADAAIVVAHPTFAERLRPIAEARGLRFVLTTDLLDGSTVERPLPDIDVDRAAMILYTSGSTGRPKGVVTTHANVQAQVTTLVDAWGWTPGDRILNVLPLHHVHGIINAMSCAFWVGATCELQPSFDPPAGLGAAERGRPDALHGRPHHLQGPHPRVGVGGRPSEEGHVERRFRAAAHGVRLGRADGRYPRKVEGDHGPRAP